MSIEQLQIGDVISKNLLYISFTDQHFNHFVENLEGIDLDIENEWEEYKAQFVHDFIKTDIRLRNVLRCNIVVIDRGVGSTFWVHPNLHSDSFQTCFICDFTYLVNSYNSDINNNSRY